MLTTIHHLQYREMAKAPQIKKQITASNRGTIRDRYNQILVHNDVQYDVSILFEEMKAIPKYRWVVGRDRKKEKHWIRKSYIESLCSLLHQKLGVDPLFTEDLIYSHASIFPNTRFKIKEGISESEYFELRMLEKAFPGLKAERVSKRAYPHGKLACNLLGYMGSIDLKQHQNISLEIQSLEAFTKSFEEGLSPPLPVGFNSSEAVYHKLKALRHSYYSINSLVGKSGIEKAFDRDLRGFYARKQFEIDPKGGILRELPGQELGAPGKRLLLSISKELQAYAEELLTESEERREQGFRVAGKNHNKVTPPWIKGGAIVAMDPKTGDILSLASYPRFDPRDFNGAGSAKEKTQKNQNIEKWLETSRYIGSIWEGKAALEREYIHQGRYYTEKKTLHWEEFLDLILSKDSSVKNQLHQLHNIGEAIDIQRTCNQLLSLTDHPPLHLLISLLYPTPVEWRSHLKTDLITEQYTLDKLGENLSEIVPLKQKLDRYLLEISHHDDKLLFIDLCRLISLESTFPSDIPKLDCSTYRECEQLFVAAESLLKKEMKKWFQETLFKEWRKEKFAGYLKEKRLLEKTHKKHPQPFLDYLNRAKKEMFHHFYAENRWSLLCHFLGIKTSLAPHLHYALQVFEQQRKDPSLDRLKAILSSLSTEDAIALIHSFRSTDALKQTPLYGHYCIPKNPGKDQTLYDIAMHFYPPGGFGYSKSYAYQESAPLGSIFKIVTAFEATRQRFEKKSDSINPLTIIDTSNSKTEEKHSQVLGYHLDGKKITRYYKGGRLPASHKKSGKIDLKKAFEQSSNIYFSLLASDALNKPTDLTKCSAEMGFGKKTGIDLPGESPGLLPTDIIDNQTALYSLAIGQHTLLVTPLQAAVMMSSIVNGGSILKPEILHLSASTELQDVPNLSMSQFPYQEYLKLVGIDFPLFIETIPPSSKNVAKLSRPKIKRSIFYPDQVKQYLLNALYDVINGEHGSARMNAIQSLYHSTTDKKMYKKIQKNLIGKTATAEILYRPCLDREFKPIICKHVWFACTSFEEDKKTGKINFESPELVVIVNLRFGDFGKEAAPIAAKIIQKYREIVQNHSLK